MEQTERIRQMEQRLNRASAAVMEMSAALEIYIEAQESVTILNEYYGSEDWKSDFAADEAGLLPSGLKRGVLSEDAVWNMLSDCRELDKRMENYLNEKRMKQ
jgi:hypothetical protein